MYETIFETALAREREKARRLRGALVEAESYFRRMDISGNWMGDEEHETWRRIKEALAETEEK